MTILISIYLAAVTVGGTSGPHVISGPLANQFLYGASVYPELQTPEQQDRMLDYFKKANFTVVRVIESSWGNVETAPGEYEFGWVRDFLDKAHQRGIKAILGTSTYIAPQWLGAKHPEVLVESPKGQRKHPMLRKAACLSHPLYREACRRYIGAIGKEFKDHPAVIGWQLDNEIEAVLGYACYNPACDKAWHEWLEKTYHTPQELNEKLSLTSWGMRVGSFEEIPQPNTSRLPVLSLAKLRFRRDLILNFFIEQRKILREADVKHWITTDSTNNALADDPLSQQALDVAGLNNYPPAGENPGAWNVIAYRMDMHRSAYNHAKFMVMETTIGGTGNTSMLRTAPTRDRWRMWMLHPVAYGATGLMYWSGNRWRGGHWPHWGGVLDWTGEPEPDYEWVVELGAFLKKWNDRLLNASVQANAVVLTDFDQRSALQVFQHCPESSYILPGCMDVLHRMGIGVDTINGKDITNENRLDKYSLVIIPAATALDDPQVTASLKRYVEKGGHVVITPFTAYQDWHGIFRGDGFGANLTELTGTLVRTGRRMGAVAKVRKNLQVRWDYPNIDMLSGVATQGYCELMEVDGDVKVIARFESDDPIVKGKPAATEKQIGKGKVIKLGFWAWDASIGNLIGQLGHVRHDVYKTPAPAGVQVVPRTDKSIFFVNTSNTPKTIKFTKAMTDRISGRKIGGEHVMRAYEVLWLEE
ncbi:MAG: beta-galactosidase [Planctomycetota bacterium]